MLTHPPLFLDDETIGVDGVRAIGAMLQHNCTLLSLNFACTQPASPVLVQAVVSALSPLLPRRVTRVILQTASKLQQKKPARCLTRSS